MLFSRRELLWMPAAALAAQRQSRRNVLLVAVDDLNNRIGCYGDPVVKTPSLDRLAARGVRFDRAYCNYPLCNPTRTSLLSGRRPETTRIFDNDTPPRTYLGDVVFLPEYFKAHGYFTARVGKVAHGRFEYELKWDVSESAAGRPLATAGAKGKKDRQPARQQGANKLSWTPTRRKDEEEPDGATARRIVQLIEQNKDRPFFIGAGFHKPHLPWVAPQKYFDMYSLDQIKLPATPANDRDDIPPIALTHTAGDDQMTDRERRQAILAYHAATSFMDAQLGVILDALDRNKLWDNTAVLLFGDHGWHLYDHLQLWRKMTVFEEAARAPLIAAAPGMRAGAGCPRLVEFVDIYPTLAELAGLPAPTGMEGTSFAPLMRDPERPWKKAAYTVVARGKKCLGRSVRTDRYRYTEWCGDAAVAEFYDHQADPKEWTNLARSAPSPAALAECRRLLQKGWKAALPGA